MKFFSFLKEEAVHGAPGQKIIPADEFSVLVSSHELLEKAEQEALDYRQEVSSECEKLKEQAELAGFEEGLKRWNKQMTHLEQEMHNVRKEMESSIVPLAIAAIKKIVGRELDIKPETIVDIIATALKSVSQHRRVTIYVNKGDLETVEAARPRLKEIFDNIQSMSIVPREDVEPGGCIIETEVGIINAQLSHQLQALETAFQTFFHSQNRKEKE